MASAVRASGTDVSGERTLAGVPWMATADIFACNTLAVLLASAGGMSSSTEARRRRHGSAVEEAGRQERAGSCCCCRCCCCLREGSASASTPVTDRREEEWASMLLPLLRRGWSSLSLSSSSAPSAPRSAPFLRCSTASALPSACQFLTANGDAGAACVASKSAPLLLEQPLLLLPTRTV